MTTDSATIAVLGAGTMGTGIAQIASTNNHNVVVYDPYKDVLEHSRKTLTRILNRQVEKQRMTTDQVNGILDRITHTSELKYLSEATLVIEAIIEDTEIKQDLYKKVEPLVDRSAVIASNTSSLSIASLSSALDQPQRFIGIHFFNPAPLMPLVEIVPAVITDNSVTQQARDLIDSWNKTTVLAKDLPGFIVNRIARPFYGEALRIYEEGLADPATIDRAMKELGGFRMGPFELMDFIGNDVNQKVSETVFEAFYYDPRFRPSLTQKRMAEAGLLGKKTGRGFYDYQEGAESPTPDKNEKQGNEILNRILTMLINQAADACWLGVASKEEIDLAMTRGVNYPKGLLAWADEIGADEIVRRMDEYYSYFREDRYRCCPLLREMASKSEKFFS